MPQSYGRAWSFHISYQQDARNCHNQKGYGQEKGYQAFAKIKYQYLKFPSFTYTLKSLMPPGTLLSMRGKY